MSFYQEIPIHVLVGFGNKGFLFTTANRKIKSHLANNIACLGMFITYTFYFYKNQIILAKPQCFYCFSKFQAHLFLLCSCNNSNLYNPWEHFWLVMAVLKGKFYTLILKFMYITFCLLAEPQTMLQLNIFMAQTLFYCKVSSKLVHSVHLMLFVLSFN